MAYVMCHSQGCNSSLLSTAPATILSSKLLKSTFDSLIKVHIVRGAGLTIHSAANLFDNITSSISGVYREKMTSSLTCHVAKKLFFDDFRSEFQQQIN